MTAPGQIELSPVESATDDGLGEADVEPPLPDVDPRRTPIEALEDALLPALLRPPCLVLFSGGRDSSVVLAAAAGLARRVGLQLPVPTTHTFPEHPATDELAWQRAVLTHLALDDHLVQEFDARMNLLGPVVRDSVRRHGILAPAGTHLLAPSLKAARGGSLVTGVDGDGLFNGGNFGPPRAAIARRRPTRRLPLSVARACAPGLVRKWVARRRGLPSARWLTPDAEGAFWSAVARQKATEPLRWDAYVRWFACRRRLIAIRQAVQTLAAGFDVLPVQPLMDRPYLATDPRHRGAWGYGTRTDALRALFGSLVPDTVLTRTSKAVFTGPYWGSDVKDFARRWDGHGLPSTLVDGRHLREIWSSDRPDARTGLLLHAAWAATLPADERPELVGCRLE
jgi:asparagine synthase (glutamine-hydrolysing)